MSTKRCAYPGCPKPPTYGMEGSKRAEFCAGHKKEGMVNVLTSNKRCSHRCCTKHPYYGVEGRQMAEFCAGHKKESMVNVKTKRCGHPRCNNAAVSRRGREQDGGVMR